MKSHAALAIGAVLVAASAVEAERPAFVPTSIKAPFLEQFTGDWSERWSPSASTKEQSGGEVFAYSGEWSVEEPTVFPGLEGDAGLVAKSKAAQHAISAQFPAPVDVKKAMKEGKPFVVQYETKLQNGLTCGGAYMKLLSESPEGIQAKEFSDKTPYTIMFGPDKCGSTNKVHFIFRHKNPKTGELEEKHLANPPYPKLAKTSALYTLIVNPDQTYEILINNESKKKGSLLEDFEPPVNPPKEIDDPEDKKPADWVDTPKIVDPDAKKPDDWDEDAPAAIPDEDAVKPEGWLDDEPAVVPDPDAKKPEEWDDEEDGEWTAALVPNPKCTTAPGCGPWIRPSKSNPDFKGPWNAPLIDNPAYKGEWKPAKIPNPKFFEDLEPSHFTSIAAVGYEIWTMDENILFDNIYVGHSVEDAKTLAEESWAKKLKVEQGLEEKEEAAKKEEEKKASKAASGPGVVAQVREKLEDFIAAARQDPVGAIKAQPDVAGGIGAAIAGGLAFIGLLGGLLGGGGAAKAPAKKASTASKGKKVDEPKAKSTAVADASDVKKRSTKATVEDE
ncbi:calnexin [Ceraceosorus bombacis]|uniref:Calnexin n=1 Tax=Ceraceosorus bombacis TaxID=401625 RepID=A0A0N7LB22_9BASI|nr:calnexin [Ceraceosorus bombacis]